MGLMQVIQLGGKLGVDLMGDPGQQLAVDHRVRGQRRQPVEMIDQDGLEPDRLLAVLHL